MAALSGDLRGQLERSIVAARKASERAARAALETLGVERREAFPGISDADRQLRVQLRARARQLGEGNFEAGIEPLVEEIAYESWHRMLFARFLAENSLLMHPSGVAVTLKECAELAREVGEPDEWMVAARYASVMLPGIFRHDDPSARVRFAPEGRNALEHILSELPRAVFQTEDSLGWVYQFWQSKAKKAVNESGVKIGAKELPAVTQLFTEDYMVRFLLENSLGAWWAGQHPDSPLLRNFEYLRYKDDSTPAAGTFPGWPQRAAEVTVMDPCCGSGHFLVAAFEMLRWMRMEEEGQSDVEAGDAVLRDNLFGLEIDPRCTQIAAFALAFAVWKSGGYRQLPPLNIACSGIPVKGQLEEWTRLAGEDVNLRMSLERLFHLFRDAPTLGSLINPADTPDPLFTPDYSMIEPVLQRALEQERNGDDPVAEVSGAAAKGVAGAARLLASTFTLVTTNVPYLGLKKQDKTLKEFCEFHYPDAKMDLATVFLERCRALVHPSGAFSVVTPHNWLFLGSYKALRTKVLSGQTWHYQCRLGSRAFETISGEVVQPSLLIIANGCPAPDWRMLAIDASVGDSPREKAYILRTGPLHSITQCTQLHNPNSVITLDEHSAGSLLSAYAYSVAGLLTGDAERFHKKFWELKRLGEDWEFLQSTVRETQPYGGREHVIFWQQGRGSLYRLAQSLRHLNHVVQNWQRGQDVWGNLGVAVSQMGQLPATLYTGEKFDCNVAVILPRDATHLSAIRAFCYSPEFNGAVRRIDHSLKVTNNTLVKVPFDLDHWQKVAEATGPLPQPYSNDPTQWLFKGEPAHSTEPLQVAIARLLGYCWPGQEPDRLDDYADEDGIVCLPPVAREQPAVERLRAFLAVAYGDTWSPAKQDQILTQVGYRDKDLQVWLRDGFFPRHCKLFQNRPFIWHIWDGRPKDGFSALVNYHKLDTSTLERLIYTYLGAWIDRQRGERDADVVSAEGRLVAALNLQQKLIAIREGEPPYDIYVRWKPKHEQSIGWNPDLNDGVRLNIRPFVEAGVLRNKFTVNWNKDRGTNPDGTERLNDLHLTLAEKRVARAEAGVG